MSKLPSVKRLIAEDYPEQKSWLPKLLGPLNTFMESVYAALNRSLTIKDNLAADMRTVELDGSMPLRVSWTLKQRPRAVVVGDVFRSDGSEISLVDAVGVRWSFNQAGQLQIDQVVGVTPSSSARYKLELLIFTG